jgi:predicted nucleic acid-binding protein
LKSSRLRQQYNLSFWDSLIVSSALSVKANYLYSEDMQNGLIIHQNLKIINPFLEESDAAEY